MKRFILLVLTTTLFSAQSIVGQTTKPDSEKTDKKEINSSNDQKQQSGYLKIDDIKGESDSDQSRAMDDGDGWTQCVSYSCLSKGVVVRLYVPDDAATTGSTSYKIVAEKTNKQFYATSTQMLAWYGTTAPVTPVGISVTNIGYVAAPSSYCDKNGFPIQNQNVYAVSEPHGTNYNGNTNTLFASGACLNYGNYTSLAIHYNSYNNGYTDIPTACPEGCLPDGDNPNTGGPGGSGPHNAANQEIDDITLDPIDGDGGINPGGIGGLIGVEGIYNLADLETGVDSRPGVAIKGGVKFPVTSAWNISAAAGYSINQIPFYFRNNVEKDVVEIQSGYTEIGSVYLPVETNYQITNKIGLGVGVRAQIPVTEKEKLTREFQEGNPIEIATIEAPKSQTGIDLTSSLDVQISKRLNIETSYGYVLTPIQVQPNEIQSRVGVGLNFRLGQLHGDDVILRKRPGRTKY